MNSHYLDSLFNPKAVAVVGASERAESVGQKVFLNLIKSTYKGKVFPVNPKHKSVYDHACFPSLLDIPEAVDLVVIATPAATVPALLEQCGQKKFTRVVILSAGFSEIGVDGKLLEQQIVAIAQKNNIRFIGPNCLGIMRPSIGLNASFNNTAPAPGNLALISQSGAICTGIIDWAVEQKIGFSTVVSLGNASDTDFGDILDYLALDEKTKSILLYVEGIHYARSFLSGLRIAARLKPVIVIKAGRHAQGTRAALSHTGALIGGDNVFDAALRRAGVLRVITIEELFNAAQILASNYHAKGNRLAIVTNGGGLGVMAADRAADVNVLTPDLSDATKTALDKVLPPHWSHNNPIDVLGDATPERYQQAVSICMQDNNIDGVLVILVPLTMAKPLQTAEVIVKAATLFPDKPLIAAWIGEDQVKSSWDLFAKNHLPYFNTPEVAVESFSYLANYYFNQQLLLQVPEPRSDQAPTNILAAKEIIATALQQGRKVLTLFETKTILQTFGIPVSKTMMASTAEEAVAAAKQLGFPIAMKINSPDITHKQDVGGVALNITNEAMLTIVFQQMLARVQQAAPKAKILGVTIEAMFKSVNDRELMVGVIHDPVFGPAISFGAGGSLVEILADQTVALPPLNPFIIQRMIKATRIEKLLGQFRQMQPANINLLVDVLMRISEMICELPEIQEMDINPLILNDKIIVAVDARMVITERHNVKLYDHMAIHPYPNNLLSNWKLKGGQTITIRPIKADDAQIEQKFVRELSAQSKYFRFRQNLQELTQEMLIRFTQIDYDREMALVAVLNNEIIAVTRYMITHDQKNGEFALVVGDQWQNQGLGFHLLTVLMTIAKQQGLENIQAEVLTSNAPMLSLMQHLGFEINATADLEIKFVRKKL